MTPLDAEGRFQSNRDLTVILDLPQIFDPGEMPFASIPWHSLARLSEFSSEETQTPLHIYLCQQRRAIRKHGPVKLQRINYSSLRWSTYICIASVTSAIGLESTATLRGFVVTSASDERS